MKTPLMIQAAFNSNKQAENFGARTSSPRTARSLRFWQGMLGIGLLCLLLFGVTLFHALPVPGRLSDSSALSSVSRARDRSFSYYIQSGQWRADMRTLASMFHYLVTPETVTTTNRPALPA